MVYGAIALTILSNVLYHVFQKVIPGNVNPLLSLAVTYLVAATATLLLLPLFPLQGALGAEVRKLNWASVGLGAVIVGLELGFLLAYRSGWNISIASLVANTTVALLLIPVGLLLFKEELSAINILGIVLAIAGLMLVNLK
ncbi:MAG TPA: EamA family transporter [Anaerolineales bacterium]|nr:EamA family transporter [Anaerolineales bacterium]